MKRLIPLILIFALLLSACGKDREPVYEEDLSAYELAQYIITEIGRSIDDVQYVNDGYEGEALLRYVSGYYGLNEDMWGQC